VHSAWRDCGTRVQLRVAICFVGAVLLNGVAAR